jgi:hypothetical protein
MKLLHAYIAVILSIILFSCNTKKSNSEPILDEEGVFKSVITHSAGDSWNSSDEFLALPMNVGEVNEKDVLLLSDRVKVGESVFVIPIGAVKLLENDSTKTYVIAIPYLDNAKKINAQGFDEFSTVFSSAKWIIEQYLVNRKGNNVIKLKSWENEKIAINYLLN